MARAKFQRLQPLVRLLLLQLRVPTPLLYLTPGWGATCFVHWILLKLHLHMQMRANRSQLRVLRHGAPQVPRVREAAVAVAVAETHQTWAAALCNSLAATAAFVMRRGFECILPRSLPVSPVPAVAFNVLCCLGSPDPLSFLPYSEAAASGGCFLAVLDVLCCILVRYIFDVQKGALQLGGAHVLHMC